MTLYFALHTAGMIIVAEDGNFKPTDAQIKAFGLNTF